MAAVQHYAVYDKERKLVGVLTSGPDWLKRLETMIFEELDEEGTVAKAPDKLPDNPFKAGTASVLFSIGPTPDDSYSYEVELERTLVY